MVARRLPLLAVVGATALALAAATATFAVLDSGDNAPDQVSGPDAASSDGYRMAPAGELPRSTAEVRLASLDGGPDATLGDLLTGRPVVVNFFASWCAPCVDEMPAFEAVHRSVGAKVTFVGMANRDSPEDARATVRTTGVSYPTYGDPDTSALTFFGGLQMPTTVFIAPSGAVVDVANGALTEGELRTKLADLFGVAA